MTEIADRPEVATLGHTLLHAARVLRALKLAAEYSVGLEPSLVPVLFAASGHSRRVGDVADSVFSDVSTVSRQLSHLVDLGLVAKHPDPRDRRAQSVSLTASGRAALEKVKFSRAKFVESLVAEWSTEEVTEFHSGLLRLIEAADQRLSGTPAKS